MRTLAPAVAAIVGARLSTSVPDRYLLVVAVVAVGAAVAGWRSTAIVLGVVVAAAVLALRALAPLEARIAEADVEAVVTLVADPKVRGSSARVDVRLGGARYELSAHGGVASILGEARMGERVIVTGRSSAARPRDLPWFRPRHVVGRLIAERVSRPLPAAGPMAVANEVRERLTSGAASLRPDERALFLGLTIGDDRGQRDEIRDRFREAGLGHLLVVSGQNVAFVLAVAGPFLRRLPPWTRAVVAVGVLLFFVAVTRVEPSVSRAAVMAGLAVGADLVGRPASSLRLLSLAVTILVLVDPLLAWSLAFQLSAAATLGIVVAERPIREVLPGPAWLTTPLSVTLAAQLGVAPLLVSTFGEIPSATIPANLLAGPVAGAVMVWGATAGLVAGIAPPSVATALHLPTRLGVGWIDGVARVTTSWGLPPLGVIELVVAVVLGVAVGRWRRRRSVRSAARRRLHQPRRVGQQLDAAHPLVE